MHSQANISKAVQMLGYDPTHEIEQGLDEAMMWYFENLK
jgi:UDP-N-acetylglucosamine 4-epimerase